MSVKSDNFYNKNETSIEVEIEKINGKLNLVNQKQETMSLAVEELKVENRANFEEIKAQLQEFSIPQIRNTVSQTWDKIIRLEEENILNSDFRKQAQTLLSLIKLLGIPTVVGVLVLYVRILTNGGNI